MASRLKINLEISAITVGNRATMPGTAGPKVAGRKDKAQESLKGPGLANQKMLTKPLMTTNLLQTISM